MLGDPRHVVVPQDPVGLRAGRQRVEVRGDPPGQPPRLPRLGDEPKVERDVDRGVVAGRASRGQAHLGHERPAVVLVRDGAEEADDLEHLGLVDGVAPRLVGRSVTEPGVLDQQREDVKPEAVDAAVEPEAHRVRDRLAHLRVTPVQVRLLGQ
jgi:hypothetical protein